MQATSISFSNGYNMENIGIVGSCSQCLVWTTQAFGGARYFLTFVDVFFI
jgi:hypothetical protein